MIVKLKNGCKNYFVFSALFVCICYYYGFDVCLTVRVYIKCVTIFTNILLNYFVPVSVCKIKLRNKIVNYCPRLNKYMRKCFTIFDVTLHAQEMTLYSY